MFEDLWRYGDTAFWIMQAVIGVIFIVHSFGKLKNPAQIASAYGAPSFVGTLHGLIEAAAGVGLIFGIFVEYAALVCALIMVGAIYFKIFKWKTPFMAMQATGWEFDLLILAACLVILTR